MSQHHLAALAVLAFAAPVSAATVRVFPTDCPNAIQECIGASAPGDVVRIATADPVDATLVLSGSLTLEAAPGVAARLAPARDVKVTYDGAGPGDVTVRGLTLADGTIRVTQSGKGTLHVAVLDNTILDSTSGPFGAIDVTTFTQTGDAGDVAFEIRGNRVTTHKSLADYAVGIRVEPGTKANASGVVAGNRIRFVGIHSGIGVHVNNATRNLTADVVGNVVDTEPFYAGVLLQQSGAGGTLTARVANQLVTGVAGGGAHANGIYVLATLGAVHADVVNNTIVHADGGVTVYRFGAAAAVTGSIANNVIAHASQTAVYLYEAGDDVRFGPNLLFDVPSSRLAVGTLIADPHFAADFGLAPGSPAVNAGDAAFLPADLATDLRGRPRVTGGAVDLGAFETPCPDGSFTPGPCPTPGPGPEPVPCEGVSCDDADPCTIDTCEAGTCVHAVRGGLEGVRCACERPAPAACAADAVPRRVERKIGQACRLLGRAEGARRTKRLLGRAARAWNGAARLAMRTRGGGPLSAECRTALADTLNDAGRRTRGLAHDAR
jgi:hypothetical protein